jgi:3'(2'), 5'-bisphosphate nucleotidase/inositol polyphosphate 1-phosphatase
MRLARCPLPLPPSLPPAATPLPQARVLGVVLPPLRMDSQVKYGLLSRGCASIFMRFPPPTYKEKIWDHAAGFVIVEEAGGRVTDAAGTRLDFSRGRFLQLDRGIIAAPPALHEQLMAAAATVATAGKPPAQ